MSGRGGIVRAVFDVAYVLLLWVMLVWSIATEDWWLFAPAAFLLIYERLDES